MHHHRLSFGSFVQPHRGSALLVSAAMFALGMVAGLAVEPRGVLLPASHPPPPPPSPAHPQTADSAEPRPAYPAQVLRVIDGDTFEARVRVWPGLDVTTKVRLRRIDAPELHARCSEERSRAEAARSALEAMLADGGVAIARVTLDKYGGRVDADASTRKTADVSAALLAAGLVRSYDGGRRGSWCSD